MADLARKKKQRRSSRPSLRKILEALNDMSTAFNGYLPPESQFMSVSTQADLFSLQQKTKALAPTTCARDSMVQPSESIQTVEVLPDSVIQALSAIATNAWRARNKMVNRESGEVKDEMKHVLRHIEAIFEALSLIDVLVEDMKGRPYDSGMALKVVGYEPTPNLSKEQIVDEIKPTITLQGQRIQMGEVIVGTPEP